MEDEQPLDSAEGEPGGTGGGLTYVSEVPSPEMCNQERSHSCLAACARQLLADAGVLLTEVGLHRKIGYIEGWGTTIERTASVLDELHPRLGYGGGAVDPKWISVLCARDPWIAALRTHVGTLHAVIGDRLVGGVLHVRDPWGLNGPGSGVGSRATIRLPDFLEHWKRAFNNVVNPERLKGGTSP